MKPIRSLIMSVSFIVPLFSISAHAETFIAYLSGAQEVPAAATTGKGYARVFVNAATNTYTFTVVFEGLSSSQTLSHIHAPGAIGTNAGVAINLGTVGGTSGTITGSGAITNTQINQLRQHLGYVNVHTSNFPGGELRGQLGVSRPVDYDGDGRMDLSVMRFPNVPAPGVAQVTYFNQSSFTGASTGFDFGDANSMFPAPGDYDGDGKGDLALYRDGAPGNVETLKSYFFVFRSTDNTAQAIQWGTDGDQAVARDYDGDGRVDPAVFRRGASAGAPAFWYYRESSTGGTLRDFQFGTTVDGGGSNGDTPVPGDYDGDGKFDLAVYRFGSLTPTNSFIVRRSSDSAVTFFPYGNFTSDYILPGDYDGDGKFDYAVARTGATSTTPIDWFIRLSSNGTDRVVRFGFSSDLPVQGDYDGDGRTDLALTRNNTPAAGQKAFLWLRSFDNVPAGAQYGLNADFAPANFDAR
ncbi:MAG: CHRD domain-containing protein [Pyrinomonadaceae bacterium]|nr:CHRD domain-containing protein [Pyrinomonadaceae bacterium]